jgi:hypothetical protein
MNNPLIAIGMFVWLVAGVDLFCGWWLICFERKILLAGG